MRDSGESVPTHPVRERLEKHLPPRLVQWLARPEVRLLGLNLAVTLVMASSSLTFFHPDEHYQVLELCGYKLGFTAESELPWEYAARIRPFMQPWLCYLIVSPLKFLQVVDRFTLAFVLRLVSGLVAFAALVQMVRVTTPWLRDAQANKWRLEFLTLAGFGPYLAVRTSSENLTASFFLFGFALLMAGRDPEARDARPTSRALDELGAGVLFGLAFECRFQTAILVAGFLGWLLFVARARLRTLGRILAGTLGPVIGAVFIDRWGYGEWTFPPLRYLDVNLLQGVAATQFGTKPFFAYLHVILPNLFAPVVFLMILGLLTCWLKRPLHVITWTTLPFVLVHSAIGHKEERFLFPVALLTLVACALALERRGEPSAGPVARLADVLTETLRRLKQTRAYAFVVVLNFVAMAFIAVYPLGWRPHLTFYRWVYDAVPAPVRFVAEAAEPYPPYPFYRRGPWSLEQLDRSALATLSPEAASVVYWLASQPFDAVDAPPPSVRAELVYSEFPGWQSAWLRQHVWPTLGRLRSWCLAHGVRSKRLTWISVYRFEPGGAR